MKVTLKHNTPLHIAAEAIRTCWASQGKSDTIKRSFITLETDSDMEFKNDHMSTETICGPKDRELIERVGNKFKHASTLEHLNYTFWIEGISRACLQENSRHRIASPSVESSRYTLLKMLKEYGDVKESIILTGNEDIDNLNIDHMNKLKALLLSKNISNDVAKYAIVEAYKVNLTWTVNARSLQNFLSLRTSKSALWEIRELAQKLYDALPEDHKYLFTQYLEENKPKVVEMSKEQYGAYMDWAMQNGYR
jgi:thymidylate synthase (FAD)